MAQLHADAGVAVAVDEADDAGKGLLLLVVPQPRAPRGDAAIGPAPPMARAPRCTRWKSPGTPSVQEYMAIGDTRMRFLSLTPRAWYGVSMGSGGR